jgi:hypothetical protein
MSDKPISPLRRFWRSGLLLPKTANVNHPRGNSTKVAL